MKDDFDISPLTRKKKLNSRAKGNRFENKIAKMLNERFETNEFCRSPGSGAFATTHNLPSYLKIYGDLITPEKFKYVIEIKKGYNDERVSDLLNPKSQIFNMIGQAHRDSKKSSRKFILIIGQDRRDPMAITNELNLPVRGSKVSGVFNDVQVEMFKLADLLSIANSYFLF
jgi:hypothetical protein